MFCNKEGVDIAINTISKGGIVVFPTDTVYGIGCDPYNKKSVKSLYKIKKRRAAGAVIVPRALEGMPEGAEVEVLLYDEEPGP